MAKPILAALRFSRNDVLNLSSIFECVLKHAGSGFACDCKTQILYQSAIEELIYFGYEAVKQHDFHIKSYLKHFHSYVYLSNICFVWYSINNQNLNEFNVANSIASLAQSLVDMLLLAVNDFAKLGYPNYYKNFVAALAVIFGGVAVDKAGLNATAARLAKMFLHVTDELPQHNISGLYTTLAMGACNG